MEQSFIPSLLLILGVGLSILSSNELYNNYTFKTPVISEASKSEITNPLEEIPSQDAIVVDEKKKEKAIEKKHEVAEVLLKEKDKAKEDSAKPKDCAPVFTIRFDRDTRLSSTSNKKINDVMDWLRTRPYQNIVVEGHADGKGNEIFNLKLSHRRAKKVADILKRKGLSSDQITIQAFGEYQPVVGQNKEKRLRRVVVKVVGQTPCEETE